MVVFPNREQLAASVSLYSTQVFRLQTLSPSADAAVPNHSDICGVGMRYREDARQKRHDEFCVRRMRHGGSVRNEARAAGGMLRLRGYGRVLRSN